MLARFRPQTLRLATLLLALATLPVAAYGAWNAWVQTRIPATRGSVALQKMVGLPIETPLAQEIASQVSTIKKAIGGKSFYVVDSSDGTLWSLTALTGIPRPQHHVVMLHGLLNPAITSAVKSEMEGYDFVVVNAKEYDRVVRGTGNGDIWLDQVYAHVQDNFVPIARYEAPAAKSALMLSVLSFEVLRRVRREAPETGANSL